LRNDRKATKANIRYNDITTINAEIEKLKKRQETTSMSLSEEKRLIKEMDALQASKKHVAELNVKEANLDDVYEQIKVIKAEIGAKDKEIDAVQVEIDAKFAAVKALSESENEARNNTKLLLTERDDIKIKIGEKLDERKASRDAFREANDKWYDYQRAVKAQRKLKYEEEKRKRQEEEEAWLKKKEEEEAKKIPYEEEMALCDYLADYLTRTYLSGGEKKTEESKKVDVIAVKDDPFAGFKPKKKKDDEIFLQVGKGKKKPRVRASKKKAPAVFTLNYDSFEQFGLLNLTPPTSLDMVEASVAELKAKKEWFSQQPRGSVPTAQDIRKANVKAAAKLRKGADVPAAPKGTNGKKGDDFDLSGDDFAPLSASGSSTAAVNASWGQKPAEEAAEPTPEEEPELVGSSD